MSKRSNWDILEEQLEEEQKLLAELNADARAVQVGSVDGREPDAITKRYDTLIRMYKRKVNEANQYKEHLTFLKNYFETCWDGGERHFDPYAYEREDGRFIPGHWCPNLIEELSIIVEEGTVYTALDLPKVSKK